jgi:hypothetical protein
MMARAWKMGTVFVYLQSKGKSCLQLCLCNKGQQTTVLRKICRSLNLASFSCNLTHSNASLTWTLSHSYLCVQGPHNDSVHCYRNVASSPICVWPRSSGSSSSIQEMGLADWPAWKQANSRPFPVLHAQRASHRSHRAVPHTSPVTVVSFPGAYPYKCKRRVYNYLKLSLMLPNCQQFYTNLPSHVLPTRVIIELLIVFL